MNPKKIREKKEGGKKSCQSLIALPSRHMSSHQRGLVVPLSLPLRKVVFDHRRSHACSLLVTSFTCWGVVCTHQLFVHARPP